MDATIERVKIEVLLDGKKAFIGLKDLKKQFAQINKEVKPLNKMFKGFAKFVGVGAFAKMAIDAGQFGRSMGLLANKTGIAATKLTSMRNAFASMGGKAESVDSLLTRITSGLAKLSMGDGAMAGKLSAMGISAWDEGGNVKSADVVMGDLADWTKSQLEMGRSMAEVSEYLHENFGIEQDLVNQLALGRAGMAKAQRDIESKTGSVGKQTIENLESLNKALSTLKVSVGVLIDKIMGGLAPILSSVADILTDVAKGFQEVWDILEQSFRDIICDGEEAKILLNALKDVLGGLLDAFKVLAAIVGVIAAGFRTLGEWIGNFVAWLGTKFGWLTGSTTVDTLEESKRKLGIPQYETLNLTPIIDEDTGMPVDLSSIPMRQEGQNININVSSSSHIEANNADAQEIADKVGEENENLVNGVKWEILSLNGSK